MFLSVIGYTQKTNDTKPGNYCLFGYISDAEDFNGVIKYLNTLNIKVIETCIEERIIYIKLNRKYKDYVNLFHNIESRFNGKCYYKSNTNQIMKYNRCRGQSIKNKLKK